MADIDGPFNKWRVERLDVAPLDLFFHPHRLAPVVLAKLIDEDVGDLIGGKADLRFFSILLQLGKRTPPVIVAPTEIGQLIVAEQIRHEEFLDDLPIYELTT